MPSIKLRLARLEAKIKCNQPYEFVRVLFQPDNCSNPDEFWRLADAEADKDGVQLIRIVFVGPDGNPDEGMAGEYLDGIEA